METIETFFNSNFSDVSQESLSKQKPSKNTKVITYNNNTDSETKPIEKTPIEKPPNETLSNTIKTTTPTTITDVPNNEIIVKPIVKIPILDPLSVIIKLAIISNKPVGSKILIKENIIHIQEPGLFQGLTRYINKTNRNDLHYLYNPICIACKKYLNKNDRKKTPEMVHLFICAQFGIIKLIETYQGNSVINLCLNYYHSVIENFVKELYTPLFRDDEITPLYTDALLYKLNEIWTPEKIKIVLDMIHFLNDDKMANDNVKSLDIFIQNIDKHTHAILISQ